MKKKQSAEQKNLRFVWHMLEGSRLLFAVSILTGCLSTLAEMVTPQIIRLTVDNIIGEEVPAAGSWQAAVGNATAQFSYLRSRLWIPALAILVLAVIRVTAMYFFRVTDAKATETFVKTLRDRIFLHISHLPYSWFMKNHTGDIIQRCTTDVDTVRNFVSEQLGSIFRIVVTVVFSLAFMLQMDVKLTLLSALLIPLILGYSIHFHTTIKKGFMECEDAESKLSAMAQENLTGVRVVRAFGRERQERDRFETFNKHYTGLWVRLAAVMSRYWSTQDFIAGFQVLIIMVFGAVFCIRGTLSSGSYIAFISYNATMSEPIRYLGRLISEMSKTGVSIGRLREIMDAEEEQDNPQPEHADYKGDIVFDHVTFGYEPEQEILHDVSFTLKAGSTLGILGGTGSGKSTMMLLLDRLYNLPEGQGTISIGGTDIRNVPARELREHIGMVLQEPFLFSRSLAENISLSNPEMGADEIREVSAAACLNKTIEGFQNGYDTFVGERGVTLSGGQMQRAAIARELARKTPILVFDDSLSAVDTETDAAIRANLQKLFGSASIILISHRITTLSKADQILVLDNGRIVEHGTHEELIARSGIYRKIYEIQSGIGEEAEQE